MEKKLSGLGKFGHFCYPIFIFVAVYFSFESYIALSLVVIIVAEGLWKSPHISVQKDGLHIRRFLFFKRIHEYKNIHIYKRQAGYRLPFGTDFRMPDACRAFQMVDTRFIRVTVVGMDKYYMFSAPTKNYDELVQKLELRVPVDNIDQDSDYKEHP